MKQPNTETVIENCPIDIDRFESRSLISALLTVSRQSNLYIVDTEQTVIYWSRGMEQLTGLSAHVVTGLRVPQDYALDRSRWQNQEEPAVIKRSDGISINILKHVTALYDNVGVYAGAIVQLKPESESASPQLTLSASRAAHKNFHGIISRSPAMQNVFQIIKNAAETEATVLVRGESGAGKELVAKAIHTLSSRRNAPFLAINCAALSSNLLESELFGHVRGAFTGAVKDHRGLFQRADGGTLFLDEVAELPLELQAKLLRVLQERNYFPVGGNKTVEVDVRIVAATHRSLREEVKNGRFREDLMYRLRVVPIFLPPLRERREDISLLIWHFIELHNDKRGRVIEKIDPDAMRLLLDYRWPGNVRELHNVVEYAFAVGRGAILRPSELPPEFRETRSKETSKSQYKLPSSPEPEDEMAALRDAMAQSGNKPGAAAALLGMSRATFWRKRKQYGI